MKVLFIDYFPESAELMAELVRFLGHEAHCPDRRFRRLLAIEHRPDVVFFELDLPDMRTCALCSTLRRTTQAELYAFSGAPNAKSRVESEGLDGWLSKPSDLGSLERLLDREQQATDRE